MFEDRKWFYGFSYFRVIACIAIIGIHTLYMALSLYESEISLGCVVFYRSILNNLMWAVPGFLAVTGALLLNPEKNITYKKLFKVYLLRVVLVLVIFGIIFSIYDFIFDNNGTGINQIIYKISGIFTGETWSHMWYIYCLIGLYLMLPFYKKIVKHSSKRELEYLLIVCVIFLSIMPILGIWNIDCGFYIHTSTIYPFYMFLGYYLSKWVKQTKYYIIAVVFGTISLVFLTFIRYNLNIEELDIFCEYSSIFVIIQAFGIIGLFFKIKGMKKLDNIIVLLDKCSFGVYLIHLMFLRYIYKNMHINPFQTGGILLIVIIVSVLSFVITYFLKKIPAIDKIL